MHLTRAVIDEVEARWGRPWLARTEVEFRPHSFGLIQRERARDRTHDLTMLIVDEAGDTPRFALMRKHDYPPGLFRPPSGGVRPDEEVEAGARREAYEETGLDIELQRYVLRVKARFTCNGQAADWVTHVFLARRIGGDLQVVDSREIAEVCWGTLDDLTTSHPALMRAAASPGLRYRADLQDLFLAAAELAPMPDLTTSLLTLDEDSR